MPPKPRPKSKLALDTRYRYGERTPKPRAAHSWRSVQWRHDLTLAQWAGIEARFLAALSAGRSLREACELVEMTPQAVWGRARWDEAWRDRVDSALLAGRDESLPHGWLVAYRRHGCRCPDCRETHERARTAAPRAAGWVKSARRRAAR